MATTRDMLAEKLQSVRDTASLLYNRMMENMGYGKQERLKNIVEKEADEERSRKKEDKRSRKKATASTNSSQRTTTG